jgi:arylsulfatase A-like enzyme
MMDGCLGRILAALDELKLTDRTLVIFTSDHGNMLGQHGMMEKGSGAFYDDLMRVPLLVRLPGRIPAGRTCDAPATSVDVAPTILDYLGAGPRAHGHGRSLRPFLDGAPADDRPVFGERGDVEKPSVSRMIRTRQWKLCLLPKGENELFDLQKDPDEIHNRAAEPALAAVVARLTAQLVEHMRAVGDPAVERFTQ